MDFDDGQQEMIWVPRSDGEGKSHQEILRTFAALCQARNVRPMDRNYRGVPNIYLRGKYSIDGKQEQWLGDGFVMFVEAAD